MSLIIRIQIFICILLLGVTAGSFGGPKCLFPKSIVADQQTGFKPVPKTSGIIFRVQIMYSKDHLPITYFKNVSNVMLDISASNTIRYVVGGFSYFESANVYKLQMVELGYIEANVVAYNNGVRILVDEAREIVDATFNIPDLTKSKEKKKEKEKEKKKEVEPILPVPDIVDENAPVELRVQLITTKERLPKNYKRFRGIKGIYFEQSKDGYYRYFLGRFISIQKTAKLAIIMKEIGFSTAFIAAYKGAIRIPLSDAREWLEKNPQTLKDQDLVFEQFNEVKEVDNRKVETLPSANKTKAEDVEFRVQLAANKADTPENFYWTKEIDSIYFEKGRDGYYRYFVGRCKGFNQAWKLKEAMVKSGFAGAFISAYLKEKKITIEEGVKLSESGK